MARTVDVGQWVQEDSIGYNAGDTNLYRYVGNNPTNQTDPSGLVVSPTGRPICKYELERPAPPDEYSVYAEGRFRGTYVGRWKFSNATYEWKGARFRSDVQIFAAAERRFKSDVAFQDDRVLTNFATFVRVEYSFVNVFRIDGKDEIKVPNFNEGYWLPVRSRAVPKLVDTTIRLLSQEPLAGRLPTAEVLRVAEILDQAGFACLEISGGGVFDATVRRKVESPWERIRAIKARVSTPLGIALRGRFLVGSRPVSGDIVGRFVACAAENGIDVFRLHDPLNDVSNLREAGAAITSAGGAFHAGLVYSPGRTGGTDTLVEQARKLPELGATRVIVNDPTGALVPHRGQELVARIHDASELPVGFYVQGAAGTGLAAALAAVEAGADLVATAVYPLALTLHRVAGESLAESLEGLGHGTGLDTDKLWEAADVIDEHIGDEPVVSVAPRIAVRAAEFDLPAGLVAALEVHLRANAAADRLLDVLEEVGRVRAEAGWPPLAAPIGQILASQALLHVLEARRYGTVVDQFRALVQGGYGTTPEPVDATVERAVQLLAPRAALADDPPTAEDVRERAEGLAASEEELVLIAMFGHDAEELLGRIRARHSQETLLVAEDADAERAERIRELVKIVQESGVGEIEIEDEGMRVSVRSADESAVPATVAVAPAAEGATSTATLEAGATDGVIRIESPMVGVFYRAPNPGAPAFVDVGDPIVPGQTLCLLEAMKLFNELKAETTGIVRAIHVENAQPVEYGQLLFEIEPALAPPTL